MLWSGRKILVVSNPTRPQIPPVSDFQGFRLYHSLAKGPLSFQRLSQLLLLALTVPVRQEVGLHGGVLAQRGKPPRGAARTGLGSGFTWGVCLC